MAIPFKQAIERLEKDPGLKLHFFFCAKGEDGKPVLLADSKALDPAKHADAKQALAKAKATDNAFGTMQRAANGTLYLRPTKLDGVSASKLESDGLKAVRAAGVKESLAKSLEIGSVEKDAAAVGAEAKSMAIFDEGALKKRIEKLLPVHQKAVEVAPKQKDSLIKLSTNAVGLLQKKDQGAGAAIDQWEQALTSVMRDGVQAVGGAPSTPGAMPVDSKGDKSAEVLKDFNRRRDKVKEAMAEFLPGEPGVDQLKKMYGEKIEAAEKVIQLADKTKIDQLKKVAAKAFSDLEAVKESARKDRDKVKACAAVRTGVADSLQKLKQDAGKLGGDAGKATDLYIAPIETAYKAYEAAAQKMDFTKAIKDLQDAKEKSVSKRKEFDKFVEKWQFGKDFTHAKEVRDKLAGDGKMLDAKVVASVFKPLDDLLALAKKTDDSGHPVKGSQQLAKLGAFKSKAEDDLAMQLKEHTVAEAKKAYGEQMKDSKDKFAPKNLEAKAEILSKVSSLKDKTTGEWKNPELKKAGLTDAEAMAIVTFTASNYRYINPATANQKDRDDRDIDWMDNQYEHPSLAKMTPDEKKKAKEEFQRDKLDSKDPKHLAKRKEKLDFQRERYEEGTLHAAMMLEAFKKLEAHTANLYRGSRMNDADFKREYGIGKETGLEAFTSLSTSEKVAIGFANGTSSEKPPPADATISVLAVAKVYNARDIKALSLVKTENELILAPGTKLKVTKIEKRSGAPGTPPATAWYTVHLEEQVKRK
jgi:hypothetical protein